MSVICCWLFDWLVGLYGWWVVGGWSWRWVSGMCEEGRELGNGRVLVIVGWYQGITWGVRASLGQLFKESLGQSVRESLE